MSKYVIDLRPDCKVVQQICESDGQLHIGSKWVNYLEELTADYINEHFPTILQDEYDRGYKDGRNVTETQAHDDAYQRGFEDGKKEAESSEAIEQIKMDAFNNFKEEKIHDAFLRGIEKGKAVKGCEGCKYESENKTKVPCILCSNNLKVPCILCANKFKNQWTAKNERNGYR